MSRSTSGIESRPLARRAGTLELMAPLPWLVLVLAYCLSVLDLSTAEATTLALCSFAYAIVFGVLVSVRRRAILAPTGESAVPDAGSNVGRDSTLAAPRRMQATCFTIGLGAIVFIPLSMTASGYASWIEFERLRSVVSIALVASMVSGLAIYYWTQDALAEQRAASRRDAVGSGSAGAPAARMSLRRRFAFAVVFPTLASILLVIDVGHVESRAIATTQGTDWATTALDAVAREDMSLPLSARVASALPGRDFWPVPLEFSEVGRARLGSISSEDSPDPILELVGREAALGRNAGLVAPDAEPEIGAFRALAGGPILVVRLQRSDLTDLTNAGGGMVGVVCLGLLGLALAIARLVSAETHRGLVALDAATVRLAGGDFAEPVAFAAEDEFGELADHLESVRSLLRTTVERFSHAADRTERAVEGASTALEEVSSTSASQAELLQHINQMMGMIHARVDEASQSAEQLNRTIEESGSSLLELGATGDELNNTAAILTEKVDSVSESLEHMVASVKQITGTTDKLSTASEDTSSSMEEMASAMRAVDISAETTANLSHEVVEKAEIGQAKVVQTIAGMEAIREATDVAEKVIRGLGARTSEIGGILDVIDDVTDETNLLALNAAIIAAQAGEHGKAFSVVADEIKELADRVLASTKEIGGLIRAVQDESENAIGAIEAGSTSVMSGVDLSAEAGRTLEEITIASRESGTRIAEIVASVREQTTAASHVVRLMERVRESAEEIGAAGAEQTQGNEVVYQSAKTMREVALQVKRTTEEQSRGFGRIRDNVVGVREAVEQITGSLGDQSGACKDVAESIERVSRGSLASETAAEKVREAIRELASQAEELREDARRFRI